MNLVILPSALRDRNAIWDYNAETYSQDHADRYLAFLDRETRKLANEPTLGKPVPGHSEARFLTLRVGRGHGHIVVYRVLDDTVQVARYFHTAQDWQRKVEPGPFRPQTD